MAILYGLAARCLFGVVFLHKAKQGRWLCAVSTHKSLPHQRTAHWFTVKSLRHGQSLISSPSHGSVVMRFLRETFLKVFASRKLEEHVLSCYTTMDSGEPGRQYCSPTWETHILSDSCSPTWETHIPSELCCSKWETHIPSDMCSPTRETHIPSDMCSPTWETHNPGDMCSPTWETHMPSEMCSPTWETHIPGDMCSPTWETHIPSDMCCPTREHISLVFP